MCGIHTKSLSKDKVTQDIVCFPDIKIVPTMYLLSMPVSVSEPRGFTQHLTTVVEKKKMGQQEASLNNKTDSVVPCVVCNCYWLLCFTCPQRFCFVTERVCNLYVKVQRSQHKLGDTIMRGYY